MNWWNVIVFVLWLLFGVGLIAFGFAPFIMGKTADKRHRENVRRWRDKYATRK